MPRGSPAAFDEIEADDDCWVVILTGCGDKAFSAGMDLKAFLAGEAGDIMGAKGGFAGIAQRDFAKPLIAAVNGRPWPAGSRSCSPATWWWPSRTAKFGIPEVKRGLMAGAGGLIRLPKRIPPAIALELALTGDPIDAQRALELGPGEPGGTGRPAPGRGAGPGRAIAENAPLAVRASKRVMKQAGELPDAEGWEINNAAVGEVFGSADAMEGPVGVRREAQAQLDREVATPVDLVRAGGRPPRPGPRRRPADPPRAGGHRLGRRPVHRGRPAPDDPRLRRGRPEEGGPRPGPAAVAGVRRAGDHRVLEHLRLRREGRPGAWKAVLMVKIAVVVLAGVAVFLHQRATTRAALAVWGAVGAVASVVALCLGVLLAG